MIEQSSKGEACYVRVILVLKRLVDTLNYLCDTRNSKVEERVFIIDHARWHTV